MHTILHIANHIVIGLRSDVNLIFVLRKEIWRRKF